MDGTVLCHLMLKLMNQRSDPCSADCRSELDLVWTQIKVGGNSGLVCALAALDRWIAVGEQLMALPTAARASMSAAGAAGRGSERSGGYMGCRLHRRAMGEAVGSAERRDHKPHINQHQRRGARTSSPATAGSVHKLALSSRFEAFRSAPTPVSTGFCQ